MQNQRRSLVLDLLEDAGDDIDSTFDDLSVGHEIGIIEFLLSETLVWR